LSTREGLLQEVRRRFGKGFLDICVLRLIHIRPRWGYEIIAEVNKMYGIKKGASTIYPLLDLLEANKLVRGEWKLEGRRRKKIYEITPSGIEFIDSFYEFLKGQLLIFDYYKKAL
jgi:PadR family transcriptional regulator PadR